MTYKTKKRKAVILKRKILVLALAFIAGCLTINISVEMTENAIERVILPIKAQAPRIEAILAPQQEIEGTIREVTAYNVGDPSQTDSSPCIGAYGENICSALALGYKRCAANFVLEGTLLDIENYGICQVVDRMNSRFENRVDIAMLAEEKERAIKFGLQKLNVKILENN